MTAFNLVQIFEHALSTMISKKLKLILRKFILQNYPHWYAMKLWAYTICNRKRYTRPEKHDNNGLNIKEEVMSGVFKGMKYNANAVWSEKLPKILGTYELELAQIIENLKKNQYDQLINIGSAEGYYAIGMAISNYFSRIITVDPLLDSKVQIQKLAKKNNIEGIKHFLWISPSDLDKFLKNQKSLLIIDCEGGEAGYLNSRKLSHLRNADILVEVHEFTIPGLTDFIAKNNNATHRITKIEQSERKVTDIPDCGLSNEIDKEELLELLDERRPKNLCWLYLESRELHP